MLGQEVSATPAEADRAGSRNNESFAEALMRQLADELEEDGRRVIGDSLAAVAQQYEDAAGFGTNALRARAEKFYNSGALAPSALSRYSTKSLVGVTDGWPPSSLGGRHEPMGGLTTNDIAVFVTLALLLALVLVLLLR
jgi:hypothetical protein